jgi:hydrogenase maturation protein HypF
VSYEAQAAIELEAVARTVDRGDAPTYDGTVALVDGDDGALLLDPSALVARVVSERERGTPPAAVAAGFHEAIGRAAAELALVVARRRDVHAVALTGGVFQNVRLTEIVDEALSQAGVTVLLHRTLPPNDGAISVGQAAVAAFTS